VIVIAIVIVVTVVIMVAVVVVIMIVVFALIVPLGYDEGRTLLLPHDPGTSLGPAC
jgi:hypothetical protein